MNSQSSRHSSLLLQTMMATFASCIIQTVYQTLGSVFLRFVFHDLSAPFSDLETVIMAGMLGGSLVQVFQAICATSTTTHPGSLEPKSSRSSSKSAKQSVSDLESPHDNHFFRSIKLLGHEMTRAAVAGAFGWLVAHWIGLPSLIKITNKTNGNEFVDAFLRDGMGAGALGPLVVVSLLLAGATIIRMMVLLNDWCLYQMWRAGYW